MFWSLFPYFNLFFAALAAALWYLFPQLMVWPLLIGLFPWLLRFAHERQWRWRTPYDWPVILFVITGLVSVWSAYDRQVAWSKFWIIVAGVILFYAFAAFYLPGAPNDGRARNIPAWLLAFFGTAVSLYFISTHNWEDFGVKYAVLDAIGRNIQAFLPTLPGHRLHPNVVGGILAMMLPFSAAVAFRSLRESRWLSLVLAIILLALTALGLLLSSSRGSWLALGGAFSLAIIWLVSGWLTSRSPDNRRIVFLGILLVLSIFAGAVLISRPSLLEQAINRLPVLAGGTTRLDLFRNSLILAQDYPFIGSGLGGFMMLYSTYAYPLHVGFIVHAHNIYLDVLIEQGLGALIALFWMWILFILALWRDAAKGKLRPWFGAAALSLTTILLHGFVEDALYGSRSLMLLFIPLAFSLPFPQPQKQEAVSSWRWIAPALALVLVGIMALFWWRPLQSAALANWAAVQQSKAELSQYTWPEWPIQDALRRNLDLGESLDYYARALALNPQNASANRRLGQIQLSLGNYEQALVHLQMANAVTPWDNATRQFLGEAYIVNGQPDEGVALWRTVTNSQNQLDIRAYWYGSIGDEERQNLIISIIDQIQP